MDKKEKQELINSLNEAKKNGFKSPLDENPEAKKELLIGQLRSLKFGYLNRLKRKKLNQEELDEALDTYNAQREKYIKDIEKEGFEYNEGDEDGDEYKKYEM